ncbi:FlgK family flagellar hook-associated protein, partial [Sporosarcina ureae]|uniref:FlgK family flagellar hook-associated protein n=1 Tax=Sporosarcina ureae TaxID=1571 RepID=UPI0028A8734E
LPNDLYDARDGLLDQLSSYVPIETSYEKSGGRALAISEGTVTIKIKTNVPGKTVTVVQRDEVAKLSVDGNDPEKPFPNPMTGFTFTGGPIEKPEDGKLSVTDMVKSGELKSLVDSYGYQDGSQVKGLYPEMLAKLDKMANEFAKAFNAVHEEGTDSKGVKGEPFFVLPTGATEFTASNMVVNNEIRKDPNKLAASDSKTGAEVGNGQNAKKLGDVFFAKLPGLDGSSVQSYYAQTIGQLGVEGQQAIKMTDSSGVLLLAVSNRRNSISSVSLDEEMTDMIRFQQAYNASARMITVMDEALDKIINGMGTVGR